MSEDVVADAARRDELVALLSERARRKRQDAAHELALMARTDPDLLVGVTDDLVQALELPEARTRWECLDALSEVALVDATCVESAFDGAEETLFDEGSGQAHLSAFRFLCRWGATSAEASSRVWPPLLEAIQCYHGDSEYREMLTCLAEFARGSIDAEVGEELARRMAYDAKSGTGFYKAYSSEICTILRTT